MPCNSYANGMQTLCILDANPMLTVFKSYADPSQIQRKSDANGMQMQCKYSANQMRMVYKSFCKLHADCVQILHTLGEWVGVERRGGGGEGGAAGPAPRPPHSGAGGVRGGFSPPGSVSPDSGSL